MSGSRQLGDASCAGVEAQDGVYLRAGNFSLPGPISAGNFTLVRPRASDHTPEPGRVPFGAIDLLANPVTLSSRLDTGLTKGRALPIRHRRKTSRP